jgi:hypothetical protein
MACVLLTLSAALVVTGCTEHHAYVTGEYRKFKSIFAPLPLPPAPAGGHAMLPAHAAPQRAAAAPPERPAARCSAVWTSRSAWARVAPQR